MCRFINLTENNFHLYKHHIFEIDKCLKKYSKYLLDDFSGYKSDTFSFIKSFGDYFWVVEEFQTGNFMGFLALDNFIGNDKILYSAEISVCFSKKAWGIFTRYCGKIFLKKCFDIFGLQKIKSVIFSDNYRVKTLLKLSGFQFEGKIKSETLLNGKAQDVEIYSIYRTYFYNNEGKTNE